MQQTKYGVPVERGRILREEGGLFVVASLERDGIVTPPLPVYGGGALAAGDLAYFALFRDGTGLIFADCPDPHEWMTDAEIDQAFIDAGLDVAGE